MLTVITSGKAAPGVSTTVWALALAWPRPVLVVDADAAGGDLVAGLLAGRVGSGRGLVSWLAATRHVPSECAAEQVAEHVVAVPEAPGVWLLPGLQHPEQATVFSDGGWTRLADNLGCIAERDVLVDAGRFGPACRPVLAAADRVLLVCRGSARSVHAARTAADQLSTCDRVGVPRLLLVDGYGPYSPAQVAQQLELELIGVLPADRTAAGVLSDGATPRPRGITRSRLVKAAGSIALLLTAEHPNPASTPIFGAAR